MIQLPLGMGPSKACIFEAWSSKYIIWTSAFAFYTVACGHVAKWSSNIWRQNEVQSISLELVTGVFACGTVAYRHVALAYLKHELQRISLTLVLGSCDTVAFGHGELANLKHELQRIPFTPINVFAAYDKVAHGHGPSKACIFLWAWGAYTFEASTSTYII